jgi:hypothetical protein
MKRVALFLALLAFSSPSLAKNERMCAEISVRFTMFAMLARMTESHDEYTSALYKKLLEGDASKEAQQILKSLIDLGWESKKADITKVSMDIYDRCAGPKETDT